ncbi:hypothetical protein KIW84_076078 [Lathyrus oleraceus]|uniref:Uncharacterized protein n=1 Tax=Pisum sativum TaxID=3888 RepID=A0A9D5A0Q4_PEA|nr:hypothetical protein KIW84_076078 [Pisum sativum]
MDLGSSEYKYTRRGPINHGGCRVYERLDRVLGNDQWRLQFPEAQVKFESAWVLENSYQAMLQEAWDTNVSFNLNFEEL